ncbi:MAG: type II toxin-antitoxin system antitoxin SocA domain-containing protein [Candidatus Humimicrobiaceae bacterium]
MIAYRNEKIDNAICYFAAEHHNRTGRYLSQTILFKYLAYLDFMSLKDTGRPSIELEYKAMDNGPVPYKLYNRRRNYKTSSVEFISKGNEKFIIKAKKNANLDYFSKYEIKKMAELLAKYADPNIAEKDISSRICEDSHNEIKAWEIAYKKKENSIMNYEDTFEDLLNKPENELTLMEEKFLSYKY